MGGKFSYSVLSPEDQAHVPSFTAVGLLEAEVGELYMIYSRWVNTETKILTLNDMMKRLHGKVTPFTRKIFEVENVNATSENIPFYKFVLGLWNFCTLDHFDLVSYIFHLYDSEGEGVLDLSTCKYIIKQIYGDSSSHEASPGVERCIRELTESRPSGEYIDLTFLIRFSRQCTEFLQPALILKTIFVEVTTGAKFWDKKLQDRKDANNYTFVPKELLIKRASRRNLENMPPPPPAASTKQRTLPSLTLPSLMGRGGGSGKSRGVQQVSFEPTSHRDGEKSPQSQQSRQGSSPVGPSSVSNQEGNSLFDQLSTLFGKRSAKAPPEEPPPLSAAKKKALKQKPIKISRASCRSLTYEGSSGAQRNKPSVKKSRQTRKIPVYGFYKNDYHESKI